LYWFVIIQH